MGQNLGSGSKLGQHPGSGSKFNVFGSTTLIVNNVVVNAVAYCNICCYRLWLIIAKSLGIKLHPRDQPDKFVALLTVLWIGSVFRSFLDPDPFSEYGSTHVNIYYKMEAKDVRFKILMNNSETQLIKNFFM